MKIPVLMPQVTLTMTDAVILRWLVQTGDRVEEGDSILEVETDKASVEVPSPGAGIVLETTVRQNDRVEVGQPIAFLEVDDRSAGPPAEPGMRQDSVAAPATPAAAHQPELAAQVAPVRRRISPLASRLAREHGVSLAQVEATGPGDLIIEADIRRWIEKAPAAAAPGGMVDEVPAPSAAPAGQPGGPTGPVPAEGDTLVPLSPLRRRIAERMLLSRTATATVTTVGEVDMSGVKALRREIPASYTVYVVRAAALALRQFPYLNSELRGDTIVLKGAVNLGVAVSIDDALVVPVVRDTDRKRLMEIAKEVDDLSAAARAGTLRPDQLAGGTFTVTNSGIFGSVLFTPAINYPQAAILGIGRIADTPVVRDGGIFIRPMMYLSLSYDHRIVDGAMAVRYVQEVKRLLEDPGKTLVSGLS